MLGFTLDSDREMNKENWNQANRGHQDTVDRTQKRLTEWQVAAKRHLIAAEFHH